MTQNPPPWQPPGPPAPVKHRRRIGLRSALVAIVLACLFGLLIGAAGASGSAKPTTAPAPGVTITRTVTSTVSKPGPTVTVHSTKTVRITVSRTVTAPVQPVAAPVTPAQDCTPGYSPCIPPGPDVDCAGGSGDGPRYVQGPVYVTGSDPYGLDGDGNGIGCQ
ncbi:MAG TPA: hypothetical protein VJ851_06870 [Jatrophihabitans sp.]|nr:hypothetical protein [Jatrophihabitans sp.]